MGLLDGGGGNSSYLVYKHGDKCFWLGKEDIVEFDKLVVDIDSVKTGWGIYAEDRYQFVWGEKPGVLGPKPADIGEEYWRKAFSVDCYIKDTEESVLWQSMTVGNCMAFNALTDTYLDRVDEKKPGQVGAFISIKDDKGRLKVDYKDEKRNTSWPLFEFHSWIDRPEKFVSVTAAAEQKEDDKPEISEKDIPF
tara:strand:- start:4179 stop:4757 length:579 start_codon:yes stop_codon:yes gene_type:complete